MKLSVLRVGHSACYRCLNVCADFRLPSCHVHVIFLASAQMITNGIRGDDFSYTAAVDACAQGGQWAMALSLLEKMRSAGVSPTVRTFSAAISACGKGYQWERAVGLLREMNAAGVRPNEVRQGERVGTTAGQYRLRLFPTRSQQRSVGFTGLSTAANNMWWCSITSTLYSDIAVRASCFDEECSYQYHQNTSNDLINRFEIA